MRHASSLQPSFKYFYGTSHIIQSDEYDIFDYYHSLPPLTENSTSNSTLCHKTRKNNVVLDKPRKKHTI